SITLFFICLSSTGNHVDLHSFPTRRSSDLLPVKMKQCAAGSSMCVLVSLGVYAIKLLRLRNRVRIAKHENAAVPDGRRSYGRPRSEEHTSELQSRGHLVCRLLLEKKKQMI